MRSESEESRANHVRPYDVPFQMIRRQFAWQAMKKRISKMRCVFSGIEYIRKYRDLQIKVKPQFSEFTNNSQDKKWHDKKAASNLKKEAA